MTMETELQTMIEDMGSAAEKATEVLELVAEHFDTVPLKPETIIYSQKTIEILLNVVFDYLHEINKTVEAADKLYYKERKEAKEGA